MASRFKIIPMWYWVVAVLAILWELMGCAAFVMDVITYRSLFAGEADAILADGQMSPQLQLYAAMPTWQWVVYGVAVFTGLYGAICLLLRRSSAEMWLGFSVIAAVIQFGYTFFATPILDLMPASQALPLPIAIIVIGIILTQIGELARRWGWMRGRQRP